MPIINRFKVKRTLLVVLMLLISIPVSGTRILFYEVGTPPKYQVLDGYSKFTNKLTDKGYEIATMTRGELSEDRLREYDILVIYPGRQLKTQEISAILWFVLTKGGGVLIAGGEPVNTNQLLSPFGMIMDDGILVDSTNIIPGMKNVNFVVDRFNDEPTTRVMRAGVLELGFYEGHGLSLSGNAKPIAMGDHDTYSDTLSFTSGSQPAIGASAIFGNGLVFGLADGDMFSNDFITTYDNMRFAENVIDWLSITKIPTSGNLSTQEIDLLIGQLKLEILWLEEERNKSIAERNALMMMNDDLAVQLNEANAELEKIKGGKIGPFTRSNLAIIVLGLCVLGAAFLMSKRKVVKEKPKEEELLGELGYEFEEETPKKEEAEEELDEEELDKELGEL